MRYIATDFGAGSGRIIVGNISNNKLELEEIHRFDNRQIKLGKSLHWDFLCLLQELKTGIGIAAKKYPDIGGIGVDTWGVDFGLLDEKDNLLGNPYCYRDNRTAGMMEKAYTRLPKEEIYNICGIQFMELNTAFQLMSMRLEGHPQLQIARSLLFMPDLFNYFLTGEKRNEYTIASSSSLLDASKKTWSAKVIKALDIPPHLFCSIVHPGELIGKLTEEVCDELNCYPIDVFAVGSHDTASAAAVTYSHNGHTAFLSSGTWSLMGMHLEKPVLTEEAMLADITNEGGIDNKITFLKNITGLWMLQNVVKEWKEENGQTAYDTLLGEASLAKPFTALVDPDDKSFSNPASMSKAIVAYCQATGQPVPETKGGFTRVILESLALKYREAVQQIEQCTNVKVEQVHIVGGGSMNALLNQLTSDATGLPVIAGPVEATAIGNIIVQAMAKGEIKNMDDAAAIISHSFSVEKYTPSNPHEWANKRFPL